MLALLIVLMSFISQPAGGGASTPGLPAWTFTDGTAAVFEPIALGKIKTNASTPQATTIIELSDTPKNGVSSQTFLNALPYYVRLVLTSSTGKTLAFEAASLGPNGIDAPNQGVVFNVACLINDLTNWSGDYQVSFAPGLPDLDYMLAVEGITPAADGAHAGGFTLTKGIVTAAGSVTPVADATYTVGIGLTTNGTITTASGLITTVQEAS